MRQRSWFELLSDEDRSFVRRFVLASGSLKAVAGDYGISYPTVRLRLDRLIEKIRVLEDHTVQSPFERKLRASYAEGRIDIETMRALLTEHERAIEGLQGDDE